MSESEAKELGKYELVKELGKGAAGTVFLGLDPHLERKVAIKVLNELGGGDQAKEFLARFKREAQAVAKLNHPNIVMVYDYFEYHGRPAIVMEYAPGNDLKDVMEKEHFSISEIVRMMSELLDALSMCHGKGVIHRDIKPANLIISNEKLKITDFGVARIESFEMTRTGAVIGTPHYMSPEQCKGAVADARSDLFSAGVIFYELLTGKKPFTGNTIYDLMQNITSVDPEKPSKVPTAVAGADQFDNVIKKALAKDPAKRFQSAKEFLEAVKIAHGVAKPLDATIVQPMRRAKERKKRLIVAGVSSLLVLCILAFVGFYFFKAPGKRGPAPPSGEMVSIPAGEFIMGSEEWEAEMPKQPINLDAYRIDKFPVTNKQFKDFVEKTGYKTDAEKAGGGNTWAFGEWTWKAGANWKTPDGESNIDGKDDHPVTQISYNDALAYCEWAGKDLPTEAQWEKAARGTAGSTYPWGNAEPDPSRANFNSNSTAPMGEGIREGGKSPFGVYDMAGNVSQWCKDWYGQGKRESKNPTGPSSGTDRVLKGGSYREGPDSIRSACRDRRAPSFSSNISGFRCAAK